MNGYMSPMTFTFRQMEIFTHAAVDGSFRRTADRLGISQPAVSRQIRMLEERVGQTLFVRTRGVSAILSEEGKALLATANELLATQSLLRPPPTTNQFQFKVMTGEYLLNSVIRPILPDLHRLFPSIVFEFQLTTHQKGMLDHLRAGRVDLAIYTGDRPRFETPEVLRIKEIQCGLYCSSNRANEFDDDIEKVRNAPFVLPASRPAKAWTLGALQLAGIEPRSVVAETQFWDVLATMIRDGIGVGLLFEDHAATYCTALHRLPIPVKTAYRVMLGGERCKRREAIACVEFFKQLSFERALPGGMPANRQSSANI